MKRVAILGCGFMGRMHGVVYGQLPEAEVVLCISKDQASAQAVAAPHRAEATTDQEAVFSRDDIDVVDICLPTFLHAPAAIRAMESGKDVLCEKPMAISVGDADRMLDAMNATGRRLMIAQCIRFWPEYEFLTELVHSGRLGNLRSLQLTRFGAFPAWSTENWLADERKSGGNAMDMHIHDTDYAVYLLGSPSEIVSRGTVDEKGVSRIFSLMKCGTTQVQIESGWDMPASAPFKMAFRAVFDRGAALWDGGPLTVHEEGKEPFSPKLESMSAGAQGGNISDLGGYYFEMKYFYDCLAKGLPFEKSSPESSREALAVNVREIELVKESQ